MSQNLTSLSMRNDNTRVEEAARSIADAMAALTHAICLLGSSEGKQAVQRAHNVVLDTHQFIQQHNGIDPWWKN